LELAFLGGDAVGVDAVGVEGAGVVVNVGDFGEAEAEVVVDRGGEGGVDAACGFVGGAADEAEVEGHEVGEETGGGVGDLAALAESLGGALGVDELVVGEDHADRGVLVEDGASFGEGGRREEVVAVDAGDVGRLGVGDGGAEGGCGSLVGGADELDAGVLVGVLLGDLGGVVGGAVVPEEEGEVGVGLGEDGVDRPCEVGGAVVDGGDEGDRGHVELVLVGMQLLSAE
jgi:hypothetical protein